MSALAFSSVQPATHGNGRRAPGWRAGRQGAVLDQLGSKRSQAHPNFIALFSQATVGDRYGAMEGAGEDGAEVTA